jgi:hypothetical protein
MHCKCFKTKIPRKYLDIMSKRENIYCQVTEIKETGLVKPRNTSRIFVKEPPEKWIL